MKNACYETYRNEFLIFENRIHFTYFHIFSYKSECSHKNYLSLKDKLNSYVHCTFQSQRNTENHQTVL